MVAPSAGTDRTEIGVCVPGQRFQAPRPTMPRALLRCADVLSDADFARQAWIAGLDDVAAEWRVRALRQFDAAPAFYREFWWSILDDELKSDTLAAQAS